MDKGNDVCAWGRCLKPRLKGRTLCGMHYTRKARGQDMDAPERYRMHKSEFVKMLVEEQASLSEIRRSTGVDPRTIKQYYPEYKVAPVGSAEGTMTIRRIQKQIDAVNRLKGGEW